MRIAALLSLVLAVQIGWLDEANAQMERDDDAAAGDESTLETVTVSATRRDRDIDSVPVAVTAMDGDELIGAGIQDTQSLQTLTPSLVVTVSGSEAAGSVVRIRGIGTTGGNLGLEPAVGVFVDGVYRARSGIALTDLVDIDQVEVLRGPQGTLFGKNTSAGAINITTRQPDFLPGIDLWASAGNRSAYRVGTAITGGVIDDLLALRFSAQVNEKDGFIENDFDGKDYNGRSRWVARGQALLTPHEDVSLRVIADYARKDERCCTAPYTLNGPASAAIAALGGTVYDPVSENHVAFDRELRGEYEDRGLSAELDWTLGGVTLNAILSYRDWNSDTRADADYSDLDLAYFPTDEYSNIFRSAEVSLKGENGRLDWLFGAFYSEDSSGVDGQLLVGADAGSYFSLLAGGLIPPTLYPDGTGQYLRHFRQDGDNWSLFTHNVFDLGAGWESTLGLRYIDESKRGNGVVMSDSPSCTTPGIPAALRILCGSPHYDAQYEDDRVVGTLGISKTFANDALVYLTYSQGFKAGGINLDPTASQSASLSFDPETVDTYELGLKYAGLGRDFLTRVAVFHSKFEDYQLNAFNGIGFSISNEASATVRGVEVEADYMLTDDLRLRGGVTFNDAKFGDDTVTAALRGQQVTNAPRWSGLAGAFYERPLSAWPARFFANLVARSQSEVNTGANLAPQKRQGGYTVFNTRAGLRFDNNLEVALWANNLTDKHYYTIIFDSVAQTGSFNGYIGEPRTFGVEVRKSF